MRKIWLVAGLLLVGLDARAAEFGFVPQDYGPSVPLQDYGQARNWANQARESQLRQQLMQQELDRRQADRQQQQTYYCRTRGGDYVPCR